MSSTKDKSGEHGKHSLIAVINIVVGRKGFLTIARGLEVNLKQRATMA